MNQPSNHDSSSQRPWVAITAALILALGTLGAAYLTVSNKGTTDEQRFSATATAQQATIIALTSGQALPNSTPSVAVDPNSSVSTPTSASSKPPTENVPPTNLSPTAQGNAQTPNTSNALTANDVLELLIPDSAERSLATARPIGAIGWVVETAKTGRDPSGNPCCGPRITFHHPGYGTFDYWGGENSVGAPLPCESEVYTDPNSGSKNWRLRCTEATDMPDKWDGVSWYP